MSVLQFSRGQFLTDPTLNHIDDRAVDYFPTEDALDEWTAARSQEGRPVPDGKIVFVTGDFHFRHRNGGRWILKFERIPPELDLDRPFTGVLPYRAGDTLNSLPAAANPDRIARNLAGRAISSSTPLASSVNHAGHEVWTFQQTLAEADAIQVLTGFTAQIICVGAGGVGQDWATGGRQYLSQSSRRYYGGAGGGAGGVTTLITSFRAGDRLHWRCGNSQADYSTGWTHFYRNGRILFSAPGGSPQALTMVTLYALDDDRVIGSGRGAPARADLTARSVNSDFRTGQVQFSNRRSYTCLLYTSPSPRD